MQKFRTPGGPTGWMTRAMSVVVVAAAAAGGGFSLLPLLCAADDLFDGGTRERQRARLVGRWRLAGDSGGGGYFGKKRRRERKTRAERGLEHRGGQTDRPRPAPPGTANGPSAARRGTESSRSECAALSLSKEARLTGRGPLSPPASSARARSAGDAGGMKRPELAEE